MLLFSDRLYHRSSLTFNPFEPYVKPDIHCTDRYILTFSATIADCFFSQVRVLCGCSLLEKESQKTFPGYKTLYSVKESLMEDLNWDYQRIGALSTAG